jgi:hypothetical protein
MRLRLFLSIGLTWVGFFLLAEDGGRSSFQNVVCFNLEQWMVYKILVTIMTTTVSSHTCICLCLEIQNTQKITYYMGNLIVFDVHLGITYISHLNCSSFCIYFIFLIFWVSVFLLTIFEALQLHFVVRQPFDYFWLNLSTLHFAVMYDLYWDGVLTFFLS